MARVNIKIKVNGKLQELGVEAHETLLDTLRERLGLLGAKYGCGDGECGACTVLVEGNATLSCLTLAAHVDGRDIETIEGLEQGSHLHHLQESFVEQGAIQCGYCTPGMIMSAKALLDKDADPSEEKVRRAISNNLCRCTGYEKPVKAILEAARRMRGEK
ncbi:MAG: (2Fe-2S)-binding protein [Deltaproteobacteria bacterium]|nr:MAG: (2Fe-2S)-binding protein [Deltaproteobacteria bacterium]